MIQRIQTLFLIVSTAILSLLYIFPLTEFSDDNSQIFNFSVFGIFADNEEIISTIPLLILLSIVVLLSLISIFAFKNRSLQMRLSVFNILVLIGFIGMFAFYIFNTADSINANIHYTIFSVMPVISIILIYLAYRAIKRDEELVRSADRIR
ncbi:MAG: hypothetical protein A2033_11400 [Bacteroidetes bacterium GWA2_31_9]|nr:MAG: hypothetical protein A2033_11400 [Bacteroidetes bacterium GWA2_31_9]